DCIIPLHELKPKASDFFWRRAVAGLCNERACGHDPPPRDLAVETDPHETAGPQQRQQHAPARIRIGQMMQYADRFDQVEPAFYRAKPHDVGLRVFDTIEAERARLPYRIRKAGAA